MQLVFFHVFDLMLSFFYQLVQSICSLLLKNCAIILEPKPKGDITKILIDYDQSDIENLTAH